MDISGSHRIPAPRAVVFAALQDPDVLKACIPGCERLERAGGDAYDVTVSTKVGPIRTTVIGGATIVGAEAPARLVVSAKGVDAAAGGGEGSGEITLADDGDGTVLAYSGQAEAHGKISQLGQRLLSGVFRRSVEIFADNLSVKLGSGEFVPAPEALPDAPPLVHEEPAEAPAPVLDAPPLSPGVPGPAPASPIAPTAVPDVPDPVAIAAAETAESQTTGSSATTRIMLVAAIVVVVGAIAYYIMAQTPPPV